MMMTNGEEVQVSENEHAYKHTNIQTYKNKHTNTVTAIVIERNKFRSRM